MINKHINKLKIKGEPTKTKYGLMKHVRVSEYEEFMQYITLLKKDYKVLKSSLFSLSIQHYDNPDDRKKFKNMLDNNDAGDYIRNNIFGLKQSINNLLDFIMLENKDDIIEYISQSNDTWDEFRNFVLEFNGINTKDDTADKEMQKFDQYRRALNKAKGQAIDFESMYTSLIVGANLTPEQINHLTVYQFNRIFSRLSAFKNYDTSVLFKTVDTSGDIEIKPWSSIIDTNKDDKVKLSDIAEKFGNGNMDKK